MTLIQLIWPLVIFSYQSLLSPLVLYICAKALTFISELGRRISVVTGDIRETTFLFQRLSTAIQRFNSILFKSSFIDGENVPESFYLNDLDQC